MIILPFCYFEHYSIIVISSLTSSLYVNWFTVEGAAQLQQAAEERNCYPGFVKLEIGVGLMIISIGNSLVSS